MATNPKRKLTPDELAIADRLRMLFNSKKTELGLTQEKAAHKLGWSTQAAVSQYLRGVIPLGLENGLKFAKLLEIAPSEINPEWKEYDGLQDTTPKGVERYHKLLKYVEDMEDDDFATLEAMVEAYYQSKKAQK